ncbi:MAG: PAS domain S-box protein [Lachnospiraceae bacterium]|nr:PAS domain S-box protein [Lachnospiraceae bacterium]
MTKRIFKNTMLIILLVLALCGVFIIGVLYRYYNKEISDEMYNEINFISAGVEADGLGYLNSLDNVKIRITWVDNDGTVLFDNQADISTMDNHSDREEIKAALVSSTGKSVRYSYTLSEKQVYHAERLSDGSVIRISYVQNSIWKIMLGMIQPVLLIVILAFVVGGVLAYRLSRQIIEPLDNINLDNPAEAEVYEEMAPFVRKITHQNQQIKDTVAALKAQKEEFELITENMQEGLIIIDKNAVVLSHNTSALKLFGVSDRVEQKNVLVLNRTKEFETAIKLALEGRHNERAIAIGERIFNLYLNPVFDKEKVAGAIIVVTDITEKEKREHLRREFSANVSHELKTPLTSISGIAEIIKTGIVETKDVPEFAEKIHKEASRLINLVEDIIKVSQLDEADSTVEKERVNLYEICIEVAEQLESVAKLKDVNLSVKGRDLVVIGVKPIVREMVFNLCDNAIKYNKPNGNVIIKVEQDDNKACFVEVIDTGIGIAPDQQERVFERFYRVDKSHSKEIGGTGLGLSIVKHGAILHNANISVESNLNQGTRIRITF